MTNLFIIAQKEREKEKKKKRKERKGGREEGKREGRKRLNINKIHNCSRIIFIKSKYMYIHEVIMIQNKILNIRKRVPGSQRSSVRNSRKRDEREWGQKE